METQAALWNADLWSGAGVAHWLTSRAHRPDRLSLVEEASPSCHEQSRWRCSI